MIQCRLKPEVPVLHAQEPMSVADYSLLLVGQGVMNLKFVILLMEMQLLARVIQLLAVYLSMAWNILHLFCPQVEPHLMFSALLKILALLFPTWMLEL